LWQLEIITFRGTRMRDNQRRDVGCHPAPGTNLIETPSNPLRPREFYTLVSAPLPPPIRLVLSKEPIKIDVPAVAGPIRKADGVTLVRPNGPFLRLEIIKHQFL